MRRNYHRKLSASIYHHTKNVGIIGILAYPKKQGCNLIKRSENHKKSRNIKECLHGAKEGGREGVEKE
jgi:hypothetical protein